MGADWAMASGPNKSCGASCGLAITGEGLPSFAENTPRRCRAACLAHSECAGFDFRSANSTNATAYPDRVDLDVVGQCALCKSNMIIQEDLCSKSSATSPTPIFSVHVVKRFMRPFAASQEIPLVRALLDARVDYLTSRIGAENTIQFQIQTVSSLPAPRAGLAIRGPRGFSFSEKCWPKSVVPTSRYNVLPPRAELECLYLKVGGVPTLRLRPRSGEIAPGLYLFELAAVNSAQLTTAFSSEGGDSDTSSSECGARDCWYFSAHTDVSDLTAEEVDQRAAAASFDLLELMVDARIVPLTLQQGLAIGRVDRPEANNNLIFAFVLDAMELSAVEALRLRGPSGFSFAEDCVHGLLIRGDVFGDGQTWPPQYHPFEDGVDVRSCHGEKARATMELTPGLLREKQYAFRITVRNPRNPPAVNVWTLEYSKEASKPFESFHLWEIDEIEVAPVAAVLADVVTLADWALSPCSNGSNVTVSAASYRQPPSASLPVRIRFRTLSDFKLVRLTVPDSRWRPEPLAQCQLRHRHHGTWLAVFCSLDGPLSLLVEHRGAGLLPGMERYELWIEMGLPAQEVPLASLGEFRLDTFLKEVRAPSGAAFPRLEMDFGTVQEVPLVSRLRGWSYMNMDDQLQGSTTVSMLFGWMPHFGGTANGATLGAPDGALDEQEGDVLEIYAPVGFSFERDGDDGGCMRVRWVEEVNESEPTLSPAVGAVAQCLHIDGIGGAANGDIASNLTLALGVAANEGNADETFECSGRRLRIPLRSKLGLAQGSGALDVFETLGNVDCSSCADLMAHNQTNILSSGAGGAAQDLASCAAACLAAVPECGGAAWVEEVRQCRLLRSARCSAVPRAGHTCLAPRVRRILADVVSAGLPVSREENYWIAEHRRNGTTLAAGALGSWTIQPQLLNVSLVIMKDAPRAAGAAETTLKLDFRTMSAAERLSLHILEPRGFEFSQAVDVSVTDLATQEVVKVQYMEPSSDEASISLDFALVPRRQYSVVFGGVALPTRAGRVFFTLRTYTMATNEGDMVIADRKEKVRAFRVLGRMAVLESDLVSDIRYRQLVGIDEALRGDLRPALPGRWSEIAYAQLKVVIDAFAEKGSMFCVRSSFQLDAANARLQRISEAATADATQLLADSRIEDGAFSARLAADVLSGGEYLLWLQVKLAPGTNEDGDTADGKAWTLTLSEPGLGIDGSSLPCGGELIATNDGSFRRDFGVAATYAFELGPLEVPPNSDRVLTFTLFPGTSGPSFVEVIAPIGVTFPRSCIEEATRSVQSCEARFYDNFTREAVTVDAVSRARAVLALTRVAMVERAAIRDVKIIVLNPSRAEVQARNQWIVIGRSFRDGPIVGWGESAETYRIISLALLAEYTPQAGNSTILVKFAFSTRAVDILGSGSARLELKHKAAAGLPDAGGGSRAPGAWFRCDLGDTGKDFYADAEGVWRRRGAWAPIRVSPDMSLSLVPCQTPERSITFDISGITTSEQIIMIRLELDDYLVEGALPSEELWDLTLRDSTGSIVDMYPDFSGPTWAPHFKAEPLPLEWSSAAPGEETRIIVATKIKEDGGLPIRFMCLLFPDAFNHTSVSTNLSITDLEVKPSGWTWVSSLVAHEGTPQRLCVETNLTNITAGVVYSFSVPIRLPFELDWPSGSIWRVEMCDYICSSHSNASAPPVAANKTSVVANGGDADDAGGNRSSGTNEIATSSGVVDGSVGDNASNARRLNSSNLDVNQSGIGGDLGEVTEDPDGSVENLKSIDDPGGDGGMLVSFMLLGFAPNEAHPNHGPVEVAGAMGRFLHRLASTFGLGAALLTALALC
eukprot:TRINITY_DN29039_c0_g2_i2.p1 TRINITY_DN29039_c0_g2~~TRINITY_DN29039_c0_g2_i2.p1  ORF type:complete len:1910 (-),score=292.03 TRINITY_DN29039_c0_g2_i2:56-5488(-)